jgi:hypothetical protein
MARLTPVVRKIFASILRSPLQKGNGSSPPSIPASALLDSTGAAILDHLSQYIQDS